MTLRGRARADDANRGKMRHPTTCEREGRSHATSSRPSLGAATAVLVTCVIAATAIDAVAERAPAHGQTRVVLRPPKLPKQQPAKKGTASAKVLAEIGPDGEVSKDAALQAFALAVGPVPGVHRSERTDRHRPRWWRRRTRGARPLGRADFDAASRGAEGPHRHPFPPAAVPVDRSPIKGQNVSAVVTEMLARYDGPLGHLSIPVNVKYIDRIPEGAPALTEAVAEPVNSSGGFRGRQPRARSRSPRSAQPRAAPTSRC